MNWKTLHEVRLLRQTLWVIVLSLAVACSTAPPSPTPSPSPTAIAAFNTPAPSAPSRPSSTPTSTSTAIPTAIPTVTPTPTPVDPRALLEPGMYLVYWSHDALYISTIERPLVGWGINSATNSIAKTPCFSDDSTNQTLRNFAPRPLGIQFAPINDPRASLSPDGNRIAFSIDGVIAIYGLSNGTTSYLKDLGDSNYRPRWSPDNNLLAYQFEDPPFASSIYITSLENGGAIRITDSDTVEGDATWSPDGKWIAFASDRAKIGLPGGTYVGVTELYLIDAKCLAEPATCAKRLRQITDMGRDGDSSQPAWAPDSHRLAFACGREANEDYQSDICVTDANGSNLSNLTNTSEDEYMPGWSPDGSYIAFTCENADTRQGDVCIVPAKGGQAINITNTPDEKETFSFWLVIK